MLVWEVYANGLEIGHAPMVFVDLGIEKRTAPSVAIRAIVLSHCHNL